MRGGIHAKFNQIAYVAEKKLIQIHAAEQLGDLAKFPGNHLEALKGGRTGQHRIRINNQYRIYFVWQDGYAYNVEIADYH